MSTHTQKINVQKIVVELASKKRHRFWKEGSDESKQTKLAQLINDQWQNAVKIKFPKRFSPEHRVGASFNEKIDLVDLEQNIAYELKVSKNNTHFEFYRDIFKVAVHNECNPKLKIKKLVFITPKEGARKLRTGYGDKVRTIAKKQHSIEVEICAL